MRCAALGMERGYSELLPLSKKQRQPQAWLIQAEDTLASGMALPERAAPYLIFRSHQRKNRLQPLYSFFFQYKRLHWPGFALITGVLVLSFLPVAAEGQNATVRSDPVQLEVSAGQTATLTVMLADAQSVYGIDVSASFDPQLVEVVDTDPAKDGVQMMPGTFPQPDFVARNVADNQAGTLRYAITQVHPTEAVTGSGPIFSVQFRAKASGGQAPFTITSVEMTDRDGIALDVQSENGVIRVLSTGQTVLPTSIPTATLPAPTATDVPPTATGVAAPQAATSAPTDSPTPIPPTVTPAPSTAPSPTPEPPAASVATVPVLDTPAESVQPAAAVAVETSLTENTLLATPTSQAIAVAETPEAVAPEPESMDAELADASADNSAVDQSDSDLQHATPTADRPSQPRQAQPHVQSVETRMPREEQSTLLLILGVGALVIAAVTALLMVLIWRR